MSRVIGRRSGRSGAEASPSTHQASSASAEEPVDLLGRVVVHDPDPEAAVREVESFHDLERVVVAWPGSDVAPRELVGELLGGPRRMRQGESGRPAFHGANSVQRVRLREAVEETLAELTLPGDDRVPTDRLDVLDRGGAAGKELVGERARLEAVADRLVRAWTHLVRAPEFEHLALAEEEPEVWAEELVRRADENVDARCRHVDRPVRGVVHGVHPGERARLVRELGDPADVGDRADGVRGPRNATTFVRSETCASRSS